MGAGRGIAIAEIVVGGHQLRAGPFAISQRLEASRRTHDVRRLSGHGGDQRSIDATARQYSQLCNQGGSALLKMSLTAVQSCAEGTHLRIFECYRCPQAT